MKKNMPNSCSTSAFLLLLHLTRCLSKQRLLGPGATKSHLLIVLLILRQYFVFVYFKCWGSELLVCMNYISHFVVHVR